MKNEMETDPSKERELRERNNAEEAQKLTEMALDKLESDITKAGLSPNDVKLLVLYLSYRGEPEEKDRQICEVILKTIEKRFHTHATRNQIPLIGHTTAGEMENEDLMLKEVSGIGYNGLSLLALATNLPIGVGRTRGLRSEDEAVEQGREMTRDAWVDLSQATNIKEHAQKNKTLFVLTQGPKAGDKGYEHFLAEGIASFIGSTREARIMNVIGGCSGDGVIGRLCHQFYGRLSGQTHFRTLDDEAVCALIPNLFEPSIGLDVDAGQRIGGSHMFHFDPEVKPHFKYIKNIDNEDPRKILARVIYDSEARISREKGLPIITEEELLKGISELEGLPLHPAMPKYGFSFPFGNYTFVGPMRAVGQNLELLRPVRSYVPEMTGYFVMGDSAKIQKGARNVHNMLRMDRGFSNRDVTLLVSCLVRRLVELMAGCKSNTEAEILKEALSSTQVMGFLAYGELSLMYLLQEPYVFNMSCWGITFRSATKGRKEREPRKELGIKGWIKGKS